MTHPTNDSVIGRLLQEVSWEGRTVSRYRVGGIGYENVLTAEVMSALDTLPRDLFLRGVIRAATGADEARSVVMDDIEQADLLFLGEHYLQATSVQPDVEVSSPSALAWIEAKRLRQATFSPHQLPRQIVTLLREADQRIPLLITLTRQPPPLPVRGHGRLSLTDAVGLHIADAVNLADASLSAEAIERRANDIMVRVPDVMAWVTWEQLGGAVRAGLEQLPKLPRTVESSIRRQAAQIEAALSIHA